MLCNVQEGFGNVLAYSGLPTTNWRLTTKEIDPITGLYYFGARWYDPVVGRFITREPTGADGPNLYHYCFNNPLNNYDPNGLTVESNLDFFDDWVNGEGETYRFYGPNAMETQEMMRSQGIKKLRKQFAEECYETIPAWDYRHIENYKDNWWRFYSTAWQVGGFTAKVINNGNGTATYEITNYAGTRSFFAGDYTGVPDSPWSSGPMRTITQKFLWYEKIPY